MSSIIIIGTQWGDEGKGKIIDILSEKSDYIVRYQGGNNAGHTVVVGEREYIFHLMPSGILHRGKICCIGNGVVIDPLILLQEIKELESTGIHIHKRLKISPLAHVIFPYHKILDQLRESKRSAKIGTTGRGIGPCYADKINRCGIRIVDLLNPRIFKDKLADNLREKNEIFKRVYKHPGFSLPGIFREYSGYGHLLAPYVCDVASLLNKAMLDKKDILFEGAQGTFLDIDFGTYPFVTSSSTVAGGACTGAGISPLGIDRVIGVAKAYATRVGEGSFPTEFQESFGKFMRNKGNEFGATTGRPRRCGWFDAVMVRKAVLLNAVSELAIMKIDVLDGLKTIKICTAYRYKDKIFKEFPADPEILKYARPVYIQVPGWDKVDNQVRYFKDLPKNTKDYIYRLEDILKARIFLVSIGSARGEVIFR